MDLFPQETDSFLIHICETHRFWTSFMHYDGFHLQWEDYLSSWSPPQVKMSLLSSKGGLLKPSDTAASLVNPVSTNCIRGEKRDAFCNENQGNKAHYSSKYHKQ